MRIPCQPSDIMTAVKDALIAAGIVTASQTTMNTDPDDVIRGGSVPNPPLIGVDYVDTDQLFIHCEQDPTDTPVMVGTLTVAIWTRVKLQQDSTDEEALVHPTRGYSALATQVLAALNNAVLTNAAGDELTWRQLIFIGPRKRGRWKGGDKLWRRFDMLFDVAHEWLPIVLTDEAPVYFDAPFMVEPVFQIPEFV